MLLGVGAMVAARRQCRQSGRGDPRAAGNDPPLAALLRAPAGGAADRAGVKFLAATGQSAKGMHDTFKRMSDEILFAARNADPYMQSHPLPAERVRALEELARSSPNWDKKDSPELQLRHDLMRAKLYGFMERGDAVARRYPINDQSLAAQVRARDRDLSAFRPARRHRPDRCADRGPAEQSVFPRAQGPGAARRRQGRRGDRAAAARDPARAATGADPGAAGAGAERAEQPEVGRRGHRPAAHRARPRAGIGRRLRPARDGLWPQGRPRPGRPRLRTGRHHARRRPDRAADRGARQDPFSGRLARMGEGRRHRKHRKAARHRPADAPDPGKDHSMSIVARLVAAAV